MCLMPYSRECMAVRNGPSRPHPVNPCGWREGGRPGLEGVCLPTSSSVERHRIASGPGPSPPFRKPSWPLTECSRPPYGPPYVPGQNRLSAVSALTLPSMN